MFSFFFNKKINTEYLKLAQVVYGGEFYYSLQSYQLKNLDVAGTQFEKVYDTLLKKIGNSSFFSFKNESSGFVATLFENKKNKELVIAYRGTERIGLGENVSNFIALGKDVQTDINIVLGEKDQQFLDAYDFYKLVKSQNPKAKIVIVGQSLGGALAQLVGAKVYFDINQKVKTFSYNAPGCKHLLGILGCDENLDYSFITNYAVMNDWCGMFGENIGVTYLIPPIKPKKAKTDSALEAFENALFNTHEGIFKYKGIVIKKPKDFNQAEGLSLWYFDSSNPIKEFEKPSEFISSLKLSIELPEQIDTFAESVQINGKVL